MSKQTLTLILAGLILSGCATGTAPTVVAPTPRPVIPEAFLVSCDPLPEVTQGKLPALLNNHIEVARMYHLCAQRHGDLVEVVRGLRDEQPE